MTLVRARYKLYKLQKIKYIKSDSGCELIAYSGRLAINPAKQLNNSFSCE